MRLETVDNSILQAALVGFQAQRQEIEKRLAEIQQQTEKRGRGRPRNGSDQTKPKRTISAKTRKAMALGQKARWRASRLAAEKAKKAKLAA